MTPLAEKYERSLNKFAANKSTDWHSFTIVQPNPEQMGLDTTSPTGPDKPASRGVRAAWKQALFIIFWAVWVAVKGTCRFWHQKGWQAKHCLVRCSSFLQQGKTTNRLWFENQHLLYMPKEIQYWSLCSEMSILNTFFDQKEAQVLWFLLWLAKWLSNFGVPLSIFDSDTKKSQVPLHSCPCFIQHKLINPFCSGVIWQKLQRQPHRTNMHLGCHKNMSRIHAMIVALSGAGMDCSNSNIKGEAWKWSPWHAVECIYFVEHKSRSWRPALSNQLQFIASDSFSIGDILLPKRKIHNGEEQFCSKIHISLPHAVWFLLCQNTITKEPNEDVTRFHYPPGPGSHLFMDCF